MKLTIPELCLVALIGPSGCGKSTFARRHFQPTEVITSDHCRALVSDDENDQSATTDAFELLNFIAGKRLARGKLVVIDATSVQPGARKGLIELAKAHHILPVAIVLNMPERVCLERNDLRSDRRLPPYVIRSQKQQLRASIRDLREEGFRSVYILNDPEEVEAVSIARQPLWTDKRHEHGPFDIIGDVHGCFDELCALLEGMGYRIDPDDSPERFGFRVEPPPGRKAVFLGDLVDRGPGIVEVLRLAMSMVRDGVALAVPGNHDLKVHRWLTGKKPKPTHGLAASIEQLEREPEAFRARVADFIDSLVSHYVLDDGKLVVAHAGMKESFQGRSSGKVREFALYGETTGETDDYGLPVRHNWAAGYRGRAMVVYGHVSVTEPEWLNNTLCVDTGCVFGGRLTALRYPERELVSVPAAREYYPSIRPMGFVPGPKGLTAQQVHDDVLDVEDVLGKRIISTRLMPNITIREENAVAALEAMSRFAADPKWLIYLPPTMSPTESSSLPETLEHPREAFDHYRKQGVVHLVCEEKHMGSRAVVIACRDLDAARRQFGVTSGELGICYTRTGRKFFDDATLEAGLIDAVRTAMDRAGLWDTLATDWVCLDCELMPWSVKAQSLLREQYAAVGSAARASMRDAVVALEQTAAHNVEAVALLEKYRARQDRTARYIDAYGRYCWPVSSLADLKLAPFHLLASEGEVHTRRDHVWHMETLARLAAVSDGLIMATRWTAVELEDPASCEAATEWWEVLTGSGGEGMVVKPLDFLLRSKTGLVQPAVKCRGREYLRLIYGPEYDLPGNLERLRARGVSAKRGLAMKEFALGVEGLQRFVEREPLRRVHECVFGVLALESQPIDPRL